MDPKNDIRNQLGLSQEMEFARWILQMQQPPETGSTAVGCDTRGFDCVVAVIRRIYAFMPKKFLEDESFADAEKRNPILRYAWQMLDTPIPATDEAKARQAAEKKEAIVGALEHNVEDSKYFIDLCCSLIMVDTFWSRPEFHLFRSRLEKHEGDSVWRVIPWQPREIAQCSQIEMNCRENPGLSLQKAVEAEFGERKWGDRKAFLMCNRPAIVRVLYIDNPDQPTRSFNELRTFEMPFTRLEGYSCIPDSHSRYALIAIAQLGHSTGKGLDYVRLYAVDGRMATINTNRQAFINSKWSIATASTKRYMLFYGRDNNVQLEPDYPEIAPNGVASNERQTFFTNTLNKYRPMQGPRGGSAE
ncbi:hypothetical protein G7Z17_g11820 [Cylindrodendrum hubeiense]|uniref:Uncharacterized protein n=1 Tax=Cylindrodendrum hubeiense TaxID=595255 RepID=A0A9P5H098_9HYPO|nr:hypothetical protein G7Z17_g11820 [Cylindrodendrum hubeiense]